MSVEKKITPPQVTVFPGVFGIFLTLICVIATILCPFLIVETGQSYGYTTRSVISGDFFDWFTVPMFLLTLFMLSGFATISPNTAFVFVFLGKCKGVIMDNGFFWVNPLVGKSSVSLKIENYNSHEIKVNDQKGSPIIVSAVVSCRVVDPEAFSFNAESPNALVKNAIDRVLRKTVSEHPYDVPNEENGKDGEHTTCLRKDSTLITEKFKKEIQDIVSSIGMEVLDANFNSMSYAPEIASVMLQRQQASAMVDARKTMVAGAVGVVKEAIQAMEETKDGQPGVKMDEKQKAQLACNLLTVMVGERGAQVTMPLH